MKMNKKGALFCNTNLYHLEGDKTEKSECCSLKMAMDMHPRKAKYVQKLYARNETFRVMGIPHHLPQLCTF
jgi:hypothetical protein